MKVRDWAQEAQAIATGQNWYSWGRIAWRGKEDQRDWGRSAMWGVNSVWNSARERTVQANQKIVWRRDRKTQVGESCWGAEEDWSSETDRRTNPVLGRCKPYLQHRLLNSWEGSYWYWWKPLWCFLPWGSIWIEDLHDFSWRWGWRRWSTHMKTHWWIWS